MNTLTTMLTNKWTTLTGLVVGVGQYMASVGPKPPQTKADWTSFAWGLGIVLFGAVSKDATTGSAPGR